jgi:DNA invertase Pin-like site-specific DNA recombinase
VGFRSLTEQIYTTTSNGKLTFHIFGALASSSATSSASGPWPACRLPAPGAEGVVGLRLLDTDGKVQMARRLHLGRANSIEDISTTLGVSRVTLYRYLPLSVFNAEQERPEQHRLDHGIQP